MELLDWMTRNKVTRAALAEKAQISRQTVHNLLTKKYRPGLDLALRLEDITKGKVAAASWLNAK